jgi:L-alanine-DL-glutamate epimerase-like enolase superfamily enzyme
MNFYVKDVERIVVQVPFRDRSRPWLEIMVAEWAIVEVCKVTTNIPGLVGYGETILYYSWESVTDSAINRLIGRNPISLLSDDSLGAGLQMALYDVVGKYLEVPMHALLSSAQVRERCPISWWSTKMPAHVLAEEAKDALNEGYLSHKFKARPWFDVREQVRAVAAVTPEDYRLDIDWNEMLLSPGEAAPVLQELDKEVRIGIYEDPIYRHDIAGQKFLRNKVSHPIATHFFPSIFPTWMREDAVDGFVVNTGGVSRFMKEGKACEAFDKNFWLQIVGTGITTAYTMHLGAVLSHARWPAVTAMNIYAHDLLVDPLKISYGFVEVPTNPGLGVTVDEDAIRRFAMKPPYRSNMPRKLLTFSFPNGDIHHFAGVDHLWRDMQQNGALPRQGAGTNLEVRNDDGSKEFDAMYREAEGKALGRGTAILAHLLPADDIVEGESK